MDSVFDPSRKKFVANTPEEAVRQTVVEWIKSELSVPGHLVETEFALRNIDKKNTGRVDILVHDFRSGSDVRHPWLLVECKRPGVESPEALQTQVNRYLKVLTPRFIMLSLGDSAVFLGLSAAGNSYEQIPRLPRYPKA